MFLMNYARGALMTPWWDLRYSLMYSIVSTMSSLLTLGITLGSLGSSLSLFCPASGCTVSSCTPVTSQSKVLLHQWWNRKTAGFRFSWAMTETCCPQLGIPLAFLSAGFLMTLQMSSTFFSVSTLSLSGLSSPCSLMSNILSKTLQFIILWCNVPSQGSFIFTYSASKFSSHWLLWCQGPTPLACSRHPDCSLLQLCHWWPADGHWHLSHALLCLLAVTMTSGIPSPTKPSWLWADNVNDWLKLLLSLWWLLLWWRA